MTSTPEEDRAKQSPATIKTRIPTPAATDPMGNTFQGFRRAETPVAPANQKNEEGKRDG